MLSLHFRHCLQKTLMSQHFWNKVILLPSQKSSAAFQKHQMFPLKQKWSWQLSACSLRSPSGRNPPKQSFPWQLFIRSIQWPEQALSGPLCEAPIPSSVLLDPRTLNGLGKSWLFGCITKAKLPHLDTKLTSNAQDRNAIAGIQVLCINGLWL